MKKRKQRGLSLLIAVTLLVSFVLSMIDTHVVEAAGSTLIIHYGGREDNDYDGWNAWVWEEGKEGQSIAFKAEDDYGKIAVLQTSSQPEKMGFIIRLNDWEDKDIASDRMIEMKSGVTEIWVTSGQEEFSYEAPEGYTTYDFQAMEEDD